MKYFLSLLLSVGFLSSVLAVDPVLYTYRGQVAGVMCSACSSHVESALQRIPGVKTVKIVRDPSGGLPKIELTATVATISRQDAVQALGSEARTYDVRSLELLPKK